jgi:excisionase family DNA binding protein
VKQSISVREAAAKLGCTLKYVYDLLYAGKLLSEKSGRQWRISGAAVEAHLKNREARNG